MFNVTGGEIVIIVLVALVVLGPERLPEVARNLGRMINKIKSMTEGLQDTVSGISDDPAMKPIKDLSEFAVRPRQKLAEYAREAEAEDRAARQAEERSHFEASRAAQEALEGEESSPEQSVGESDPDPGFDPQPGSQPEQTPDSPSDTIPEPEQTPDSPGVEEPAADLDTNQGPVSGEVGTP